MNLEEYEKKTDEVQDWLIQHSVGGGMLDVVLNSIRMGLEASKDSERITAWNAVETALEVVKDSMY